jgi:glycerol uptake facilitator-like aquaporin
MTATHTLPRRLVAEALGTAILVATVVGSGIMASRLTQDQALQLLANTLPTGAILIVLITCLGPLSGAHFNPAVTLIDMIKKTMSPSEALLYVMAQIGGGVIGTCLAHLMFELPLLTASTHMRTGSAQWLSEAVATSGLIFTIAAGRSVASVSVAWLVGLYITAAYWFTASTSFANPAVTIARSLTDSFSGIRPEDAGLFIMAQCVGALMAGVVMEWLLKETRPNGTP